MLTFRHGRRTGLTETGAHRTRSNLWSLPMSSASNTRTALTTRPSCCTPSLGEAILGLAARRRRNGSPVRRATASMPRVKCGLSFLNIRFDGRNPRRNHQSTPQPTPYGSSDRFECELIAQGVGVTLMRFPPFEQLPIDYDRILPLVTQRRKSANLVCWWVNSSRHCCCSYLSGSAWKRWWWRSGSNRGSRRPACTDHLLGRAR